MQNGSVEVPTFSQLLAELPVPTVEAVAAIVDEIREPSAVPESTGNHSTASKRRLADELRRGFVIPRVEGRIVHSIHRYRSFDPPGTLTFRFTQVFKRFIGVSQHGNHYHVIHDCSSRGKCRHLEDGGSIRLTFGQAFKCWTYYRTAEKELRLENLLKYVDAPETGRRLLFVFSPVGGLKSFRDPHPYDIPPGREEADDPTCPDIEESTELDPEGGESSGKRVKREAQINFQQAAKLAAMEGVWSFEEASRIGSIRKHPVYGEQLLRKKMNKKVWELFIHKVDVYLASMLTDYSELTFTEKRIYWDQFANPGFGVEGVEDVMVSTTRLIHLIDFNFADPKQFLEDCLSWFNNSEIKRRTLVFVGPADSFKSWIARGMCRLLGKAAKMEPFKKGATFSFASLTDCNCGLFEEAIFPIYAPEYSETMKSVMEGNSIEVNVKYQNATPTMAVPIIMTTNQLPWASCNAGDKDAFAKRSKVYTFFNVPQHHEIRSHNSGRPCNPLAWFNVFNHYGINV